MAENNRVLTNLYTSVLQFLVPMALPEMYERIVREAIRLVGADAGTIYIFQNERLERVFSTNISLTAITPRKHGYTYSVFQKNQSVVLNRSSISKIHPEFCETPYNSDYIMPLSYQNKAIGVLSVMAKPSDFFSQALQDVLNLFTPFATLAIYNAQLLEAANKALETRDLFISMASHELKTPVTTITIYAELLKEAVKKGNVPNENWIETLNWNVTRLRQLINELLRLEQVKTGELRYLWSECSLSEIISRAIVDYQYTKPDNPINFTNMVVNESDVIKADYDKMLQVLFNLFTNATKFSKKNQPIAITLQDGGDRFIVSVADSGMGIPANELPHIFERFYKGGGHTKEGMGLGLYLTKTIIEEHGGTIAIDSILHKGTTVTVKLPKSG